MTFVIVITVCWFFIILAFKLGKWIVNGLESLLRSLSDRLENRKK